MASARNYAVDQSAFKASWQFVAGQASACGAAVARPAAELHLCGGFEAGALLGQLGASELVIEGKRVTVPWLALHAGALLTVRLHRLVHLWASVTPVFAHTRLAIDVNTTSVPADRV